jgi:poly-beta-1,6-N-acetyl-D-glucosamine synthase
LIIFEILFWVLGFLFFWTFFGYPLFMLLRSKIAPTLVKKDPNYKPSVTVLIAAYNEVDVIRGKIENSLQLDYPNLEVLIVNDGSDDGTREIIEEYADKGIRLVNQTQRGGKMGAVNRGFAEAKGDIVVLSDASPHYDNQALNILVQSFADSQVGVVVGTFLIWDFANSVAKPAGLYWKYEAALRKWESRTGSTVAVHGNMFGVRRHLFRPLTTGTVNDEFSIAMETLQQNQRVVYEPDALCYDSASDTMRDEFKRRARINAGRWQALFSAGYLSKAPTLDLKFRLFSHKLLRPLTPFLMIGLVITNILLVLGGGNWLYNLAISGQIAFYGLALLGYIAEQNGIKIKGLNVPYYFVSSNFAALVGLWRWVRNAQRVTWQKREANK